jgi:hypothetical protein
MGNAQSSNYLRESIYTSATVINKSVQDCGTIITQEQLIDINNCSNIDFKNINMNQVFKINTNCVDDNTTDTEISQIIEDNITQAATSLVKDYGIGQADAKNTIEIMESVSSVVSTSFYQDCTVSASMRQNIKCKDSDNIIIDNVTMNQNVDGVVTCVESNTMNTDEVISVINTIDQTASATVSGINWTLIIVVFIIMGGLAFGGIEWVVVEEAGVIAEPKKFAAQIFIILLILWIIWLTDSWGIFKIFKDLWEVFYKILKAIGDVADALTDVL